MITPLFGLLLLASDPAAAASAQPAVQPTAEAPKEERKICKREASTESRLGAKRICLTEAEWRARDNGDATRGLGDVSK